MAEMGVVAAFQIQRSGNVWRYFNIDDYFNFFFCATLGYQCQICTN